jgi:IclR family acetate operon transcriptional repressor
MNRKNKTGGEVQTVRSVERAAYLLEALMTSSSPLSLAELSEQVNLHPSTAHRLLATLDVCDFVYQDSSSKLYSPGVKLMFPTPGLQKYYILRNFAAPILNEISNSTGEGASLGIRSGNHAIIIARAASGRTVDVSLRSGIMVPLHCTGIGKAMLAYLFPSDVEKIIADEGMIPSTPNTIADMDTLKEELVEFKKQGYAIDNEEWETGIRCVAVPVFQKEHIVVGAISVSGPAGRLLQDNDDEIAELIKIGAERLSAKLGYHTEMGENPDTNYKKEVA